MSTTTRSRNARSLPIHVPISKADKVEAIAVVKGARHRLAADLRHPVEILVVERMIFGHRLFDRVPVDRRRGEIHESLDLIGYTGFEDIEGASHIDVGCRTRILVTLQQPERSEMKDVIHAFRRRIQNIRLADVPAYLIDLDTGILHHLSEILLSAPDTVVVDTNLCDIFCHQLVNGVQSDEPGPTDH